MALSLIPALAMSYSAVFSVVKATVENWQSCQAVMIELLNTTGHHLLKKANFQ